MMMTNGVGAYLGSKISGWVIDHYFTQPNGDKTWHGIWLTFAIYALVVAVLFTIFFKHKHVVTDREVLRAETDTKIPLH
jgi:NHS family xanthosine MFS transporter